MTGGKLVRPALLLALSPFCALEQADLGPRTPVEGGAIIMPGQAPPRQERGTGGAPPVAPAPQRKKPDRAPPAGKRSRQDDCKGNAAHCRQDSAR